MKSYDELKAEMETIQLIRTQFNRHSNWLQCNAIGGQQWQANDTPKSLKLLRLLCLVARSAMPAQE